MRVTEYLHAVKNGIQSDDIPQYTHIDIKNKDTRRAIATQRRRNKRIG